MNARTTPSQDETGQHVPVALTDSLRGIAPAQPSPEGQTHLSLTSWFQGIPEVMIDRLLRAAMRHAAHGLAEMVGCPIQIARFQVKAVPLSQLAATSAAHPETEMIGVYLVIRGGLRGQAILLLPPADALHLIELLLNAAPGTLTLGELERSTLAEIGNLMVSYFLNALAASLGRARPSYPSPPAVMTDMLGAMLDVLATPVATQSEHLLLVTCSLRARMTPARPVSEDTSRLVQFSFWVLPDPTRPLVRGAGHG